VRGIIGDMAQISPFSGIRYNPQTVPDLSAVVAPPYDVLSKDEVAALHARDPYNITHLTRPSTYAHAAKLWDEWRGQGILAQDRSSMYLYRQEFIDPETGRKMPARTGLICALQLEDYESGGVLPHENTIAAHRADRLELMRTTHANTESIYGLYSDDSGVAVRTLKEMETEAPVVTTVADYMGSSHTLQQISDPGVTTTLQKAIGGHSILIADGHHRYETALAYRRERPDEPGSGAILITLTAFQDEGLLVLPTHRLVRGVDEATIASLPKALAHAGFEVTTIAPHADPLPPGTLGFDMLLAGGHFYRALLPSDVKPSERISGEQSAAWKTLDVTVLHKLVLEDLVGIPMASLAGTDQVRYTRDAAEARAKVASGEFQAAFLLSRPTLQAIRAVSATGDRMPQKSTFFYPKLLSGLVMRSLV
jgi:uncharacterized protein (DUF1015 family)